jgi:hypothetical protein
MTNGFNLWADARLQMLVDNMRQGSASADVIIQRIFPNASPTELSRLSQQAISELGRFAQGTAVQGGNAIEALRLWAEESPNVARPIAQQLRNAIPQGANPQWVANALRDLVRTLQQSGLVAEAEAVLGELATTARTSPAARVALQEIEENPGLFGTLSAMAGRLLGSLGTVATGISATTVLMAIGVTALLGVATYYGSRYLGELAADKSVQAGPRGDPAARRARGDLPARPSNVGPGSAAGPYYVYVLDISGGSVWIGQEETLKHTHSCSFAGGGLCKNDGTDRPPAVKYQSGKFVTLTAATKAWCQELSGKPKAYWQVAGDSKAPVYGGNYWLGLAPGCG